MSKTMEQLTAAFGLNLLQDIRTLYLRLKNENKTMDEFLDYMESLDVQRKRQQTKRIKQATTCPNCGAPIRLLPVNTTPANQVGGKYKALISCIDWKNCGYERYSEKSVQEEFELLRRKENGTR